MNISFSSDTDKEKIKDFVGRYPELYYNKHEFVNSIFEFINGDKEKFIIHYHPLNRLNIKYNSDVNLPVYQIQKFKFINRFYDLFGYDELKPDIDILTKWADNIDWCTQKINPIIHNNWNSTLNQIFTDGEHLNVADLGNCFNNIHDLILHHDKLLHAGLLNIKSSDDLVHFIITFLKRMKCQYNDTVISHCMKVIPLRIKAVCPDKLEQYYSFIELFLSKDFWLRLGIRIDDRPIYNYLKPKNSKQLKREIESTQLIDSKSENENNNVVENLHLKIFKDKFSFDLFKLLQKSVAKDHPDYSYFYRRMQEDENHYIHYTVSESNFRRWLDENNIADIKEKLKTIGNCHAKHKELSYNNAIDQLKSKSIN